MTDEEKIIKCIELVWNLEEIYDEDDLLNFQNKELSTYDQHESVITTLNKYVRLKKENEKLLNEKIEEMGIISQRNLRIEELEAQIEKMKNFIFEEIDFCFYCPLTDTCKNDEGTCPYANITEEEQKNLLSEWITK